MFSGNRTSSPLLKGEPIENESRLQQQRQQQQHLASEASKVDRGELAGSRAPANRGSNKLSGRKRADQTPEREEFLLEDQQKKKSAQLIDDDNIFKKQAPLEGSIRGSSKQNNTLKSKKKAILAKEETIDESGGGCCKMVLRLLRRKRIFIPLIIISYIVATYCLPYIEIQTQIKKPVPRIPFNFRDGPLRPSTASQFKVERLFNKQLWGAESVALDSVGNMYMAVEGGFILYAHLNKSSPIKRSYYYDLQQLNSAATTTSGRYNTDPSIMPTTTMTPPSLQIHNHLLANSAAGLPDLVKIAELNGIRQLPYDYSRRKARESGGSSGSWRRECQLDEKVYGQSLYSGGIQHPLTLATPNEIDTNTPEESEKAHRFISNVIVSRCSKPLGIRLSPDESYLYVIDTLRGLYRISLQVPDKPHSTQRLVTKLVDFNHPKSQMLPITQLDVPASQQQASQDGSQVLRVKSFMNVSLKAVDDLSIDYGAGTRGGDIIYMSLASQTWPATSFLYDVLEARPSGAILRYDSGNNQLSLLDPARVSHVRTSSNDLNNITSRLYTPFNGSSEQHFRGIGAPNLDENDEFDDRPLHFPNGLQLTDDKQAILIADTSNKRIVKHYIRGVRKGTSDLWAWTPNFPDNIRRGYDKNRETYWVIGCGGDTTGKFDPLDWLSPWPMLRKFCLKQIYLAGWIIEQFGTHLLQSTSVRDFGYSLKIGHNILEYTCAGMMILQYNSHGDIIRSIYSKEFPNDLFYYSQANEVIDAKNQEHILYLSSPSYAYVTKLTLPTESFDLPTSAAIR